MKVGEIKNGVIYLTEPSSFDKFEGLYHKVRAKEQRILSDEIISKLPDVSPKESIHFKEWRVRSYSISNLQKYLSDKKARLKVMDLGCGNGWASAALAKNELLEVSALDLNEIELRQAARIFNGTNLQFFYGNIFDDIFESATFDIITMNASIQYFRDLSGTIERLFYFLKPGGEIHIMDSPFYKKDKIAAAKIRTQNYYASLGFPEMADHYFHHHEEELRKFNYQVLSPNNFLTEKFDHLIRGTPPEFKWIRIFKDRI